MTGLRRKRYGSRSGERLAEPGEHDEVGVQDDALQATYTQRGEAVVVLQPAELALNSGAAPVEVAPPLRLARNERIAAAGLHPHGGGLALAGWAAPLRRLAVVVSSAEVPDAVLADGRAGRILGRQVFDREDGQRPGALDPVVERPASYALSAVMVFGRNARSRIARSKSRAGASSFVRAARMRHATGRSVRVQTAAWSLYP